MGYAELSHLITQAENSPFYSKVMDCMSELLLADETTAIIVMTLEKCKIPPSDEDIRTFVCNVTTTQLLTPSGTIRSRQMIATIAMFGGLK